MKRLLSPAYNERKTVSENGSGQANKQSFKEEYFFNVRIRCTHRLEDSYLIRFFHHDHQQRADDIHGSNKDDQTKNNWNRLFLKFNPCKEVSIELKKSPRIIW